MTIKIPETTFFGKPVKGAIERVFKKQDAIPEQEQEPQAVSLPSNLVASDYVQIPGTNTIISKFELLGYNNLNWEQTHFKLQENGLFMPIPNLFIPHFMNVVDAHKNKKPLFNAAGNPIPENEVEDIYFHLTKDHIAVYQDGQKGAWAWLDAKFKGNLKKGTMKIHTDHRVVNGNLKPQTIQDLEQCIKEDCFVDLKFNSQSLPIRKSSLQDDIQGENLYFLYPRNESVARFSAFSNGSGLVCDKFLRDVNPSLGVFACASTSQQDSKDFIYVPSIGSYVAKEKILHGLDRNRTHEELRKKGSKIPTIPEFIGFVNHLKQNPKPEYNKILDEIIGVKNPYRAEHLDTRFEEIKGEMHIHYAGKTEKLDSSTLMEERRPGIDIDYWLKNPTSQGLPLANTPKGNLYYYPPENGKVVGFGADSDGAYLDCSNGLGLSDSRLGVREVRNTVP